MDTAIPVRMKSVAAPIVKYIASVAAVFPKEINKTSTGSSDTEKSANYLDLKYPGSTLTQVLKSHGKDNKYLVLGTGRRSFCQSFGRFYGLVLLSWTKANYSLNISHALAMNRHILVSHFGHLASLVWAKLILGRFRDA